MKKLFCLALIFTMMLTACSRWNVEIVDPTKPVENEEELSSEEEKAAEEEKEQSKVFLEGEYFEGFNIVCIDGENIEKYYFKLPEEESGEFFAMEEFGCLSVPSDRSITKNNEVIVTFYDKFYNSVEILVYENDLLLVVNKSGVSENFSMPKTAEEKIRAFTDNLFEEYAESGYSEGSAEFFAVPGMEAFDIIRLFNELYSPFIELNNEEYAELQKILNPEEWSEIEDFPDELYSEDAEPENILSADEPNRNGVLYIYRYGGKCYIRQEFYGIVYGKRCWVTDIKTADEIDSFRLSVYENFKNDGRWPYMDAEEEPYLENSGEFDREEFIRELNIFIECTSGSHGAGTEYTAEKAGIYSIMKAYIEGSAAGINFGYDDDGCAIVPEKEVNEAAKYGFGIREYSKYVPSNGGMYRVPFDTSYKNPKIESIVTNGKYIYCTVNFYDLGDTEFEGEILGQKEYTFMFFEAEGKTRYRLISMYYIFGDEYGF